jgi:preprotein translocase subunit SecA
MIDSLVKAIIGTKHDRTMKRLKPVLQRVNDLESSMSTLSDDELRARTAEFRQRIANGEAAKSLLPEAFAVGREAGKRALGMRHYDVQVIGGMVLFEGSIAEMKTGEGKTLTATLPLYLAALEGKGAHLVTVNDYLARRDAEWMGKLYGFLGLTTGVVYPDPALSDTDRRRAYACDITYVTNNEVGFDYLRDNMKQDIGRLVQRGLQFAIVDEVDSILIDEARTPLIISGEAGEAAETYIRINTVIQSLKRDRDYIVDEEHRSVSMLDSGVESIERQLGLRNLYDAENIELVHHVNKALEAHTLYQRDVKYLVEDDKVVIVDEFTGRKMHGRRWSDGLHQAVEAKEGVPIKSESVTMATITFQNFFRMYAKLGGMTGTAQTEEEELKKTYNLDVVAIPTNRKVIRVDHGDLVYRTEKEKFDAIIAQIEECHAKGQPVLVGTISVEKSEVISKILTRKGIGHEVLNAKQHGREATIIAQAGRSGAVTISTNMAGRGTDILLGGNPELLAKQVNPDEGSDEFKAAFDSFKQSCKAEREEVLKAGGLFILGTERHESRRIDNQLRGRAGRQGDVGESRFFISLEDDLMKRFGADRIMGLMSRMGMEEGVPIESGMVSRSIEGAQKRVEGRNFDIRKHLLEYDDVMDLQRKTIYSLRKKLLYSENLENLVLDALDDTLQKLIKHYADPAKRLDERDHAGLAREIHDVFGIELKPEEIPHSRHDMETALWRAIKRAYNAKAANLEAQAATVNERYAEDPEFKPFTGQTLFLDFARQRYMSEIDRRWIEQLEAMRALRESVGLHGYASRDPKQIYKKEGFAMFESLLGEVHINAARVFMRTEFKAPAPPRPVFQNLRMGLEGQPTAAQQAVSNTSMMPQVKAPARREPGVMPDDPSVAPPTGTAANSVVAAPAATPDDIPLIGRNDPCWCGSGKKYKLCHLREDQAAGRTPRASGAAAAGGDEPTAG